MIGSRTQIAHAAIRRWLRDGGRAPGDPIVVKDTAFCLKLSVTPVREALERLVGEGLVSGASDRAGFILPRLGPRDYVELIGLHAILVDGAATRALVQDAEYPDLAGCKDSRDAAEVFFDTLFVAAGGKSLANLARCVGDRLAPFRLVEPQVLGNDISEIKSLAEAVRSGKGRSAFRAYHKKRTINAVEIVQVREDMMPLSSATEGREK